MGSLPSPSPPATPPHSPEFSVAGYRVYVSFCDRKVSNWIECYDPRSNTWTHVTSIPGLSDNHVLKDFAMVALGDWIYIIGGRLRRRDTSCTAAKGPNELTKFDEVDVSSAVLRYNVQLDQWFECAPLGVPRYDFACAMCDNKIYVAGGQSNLANAKGISFSEVYDPSVDTWSPLPDMSTLRYKCVGVTWEGKINVVGGFAFRTDSDMMVPYLNVRSSAEVYDTEARKWDLVAGMWQLDVPPNQIVAIGGKLFSSGDCLQSWKGHIETYDGKLNMWNVVDGSHLKSLNSTDFAPGADLAEIQRMYLTMAPIGPHLYFLAGYRVVRDTPRTVLIVHVFDTSATSHAWRSFEHVEAEGERELCTHCCVVQLR